MMTLQWKSQAGESDFGQQIVSHSGERQKLQKTFGPDHAPYQANKNKYTLRFLNIISVNCNNHFIVININNINK